MDNFGSSEDCDRFTLAIKVIVWITDYLKSIESVINIHDMLN